MVSGKAWGSAFSVLFLGLFSCGVVHADIVVYADFGGTWKYFPGLTEASSPDPTAWRSPEFDDSSWASGVAPFGYGRTPPYVTDLSTLKPPMQENYTTLFLRATFEVPDPARVKRLTANAIFDDALVLWINGQEVHRTTGTPIDEVIPFDAVSTRNHSGLAPVEVPLGDASMLVPGTNTLAVHVLNRSLTNIDFKFDLEVLDTDGPDLRSPEVTLTKPVPGIEVRTLTEIQIVFDEPVTGVTAEDLLVDGTPATLVDGDGAGPYRFTVATPPVGQPEIRWSGDHGITDVSVDRNPFAGGSWTYRLDPDSALPTLVINEILVANRSGDSWIEIANPGTEPISLLGMSLSDDPGQPDKWVFPDVVVEAGGFLVVFASGEDEAEAGADLHTSFALRVVGEYLSLFTAEVPPTPIAELAPQYPPQAPDVSYGRDANGRLTYLDPPTPGAPNTDSATLRGIIERPVATVEHGFFDGPFSVELHASTNGAEIRYTLDGKEPTQTEGLLYETPLVIEGTTPLRARAFLGTWVPSPILTATYLFLDDVLTQENLSRAVVDDPASNMKDALLSIPSLSIVMDRDEMFGGGGAYNSKGDHATSVELLNADGTGGLQVDCSIEHHSNASPKTSLRLMFKREYGAAKLRYPFFESAPIHADSAVNSFDRLILRSGKNQSWTSGRFLDFVTYVEDQWVRDSQRAMSGIGSHGAFVHLYINGVYWGLYNPVERPDHWFTSAYFGGDERDYFATNFNVTEGSGQHIRGDPARYDRMIEVAINRELATDPEQYAEFLELVDIDTLIDYIILFWFSGFGDGINNNWYAGMRLDPPGKFRFFMWDGEFIFLSTAGPPGNDTAWVHPAFFDGSVSNSPMVRLNKALFDHPDLRMRFADRVFHHCFHDGALTKEATQLRLKKLTDFIDLAILGESARWGGGRRRDPTWLSAVERLHNKLERNVPIFITALRNWSAVELYPDFDPPLLTRQGGQVESGFQVTAFTTVGRILYTLDGSDPRLPGGAVAPQVLELDSADDLVNTYVDDGAAARSHVPTDDTLGLSWIEPDFDDSTWSEVTVGVGYDQRERFTEQITTNIETDLFEKGSSLYLRLEFDVEDAEAAFLWLDMKYDDGFAVYLNGTHILSFNTPEELTWDSVTPRAGSTFNSYRVFDVSEMREALRPGRNVLAIHGVNRSAADLDFLVSPRLRAGAFGNTPITITENTTVRSRALSEEGVWSALSTAKFTVSEGSVADLEITEISYNPDEDGAEFIEIHNPTDTAIPLGSTALVTGIRHTFIPGQTLAAGGYLVLARDADVFARAYPEIDLAGTYVGNLANSGEKVTLQDAAGVTIVSVEYNDGDFWPLAADGLGYTLVLADPDADPDDLRAWRSSSAAGGSPGEPDAAPLHDGVWINEVLPGTDGAVELWNWSGAAVDLSGWFLSPSRTDATALMASTIPAGTNIPATGYLVVTAADLGFSIPSFGGAVYLSATDGSGELTGYVTGVDFGALESGVSFGIHETSAGILDFTALATVTLGEANAAPRAPQVAINELHYHPVDAGDEFLELFNPGTLPANIGGWQVDGLADVFGQADYEFPVGTVVPPTGFLVLTRNDPTAFRTQHNVPASVPVLGPYGGALSNAGETVRLRKPLPRDPGVILVDRADYNDRAPWPVEPDGDGNSLERIDSSAFGNDPQSWATSLTKGGTPGATNTVSEPVEPPTGGLQVPGNISQTGELDMADSIALLNYLFLSVPTELPCSTDAGNRTLLDADGTNRVDLSDAVRLLQFLFLNGPPHVLGTQCIPLMDCPTACNR
jgi:hypothetical protein